MMTYAKQYQKRRPILLKVIGDTCVYVATLGGIIGTILEAKITTLVLLFFGALGFFFSHLFKEIVDEDIRFESSIEETKSSDPNVPDTTVIKTTVSQNTSDK